MLHTCSLLPLVVMKLTHLSPFPQTSIGRHHVCNMHPFSSQFCNAWEGNPTPGTLILMITRVAGTSHIVLYFMNFKKRRISIYIFSQLC